MLREDWLDVHNQLCKITARSWVDDQYRERLIADPRNSLREAGINIPENVEIQVDPYSSRWKIELSLDLSRVIFTLGLPYKPSDVREEQIQDLISAEQMTSEQFLRLGCVACGTTQ